MKLIAFDADDTLWANEPNYIDVKLKLCELLSHYVSEETLSQQFYDSQIRNLAMFAPARPSGQVARGDTRYGNDSVTGPM